jgi:hypothetical protein
MKLEFKAVVVGQFVWEKPRVGPHVDLYRRAENVVVAQGDRHN